MPARWSRFCRTVSKTVSASSSTNVRSVISSSSRKLDLSSLSIRKAPSIFRARSPTSCRHSFRFAGSYANAGRRMQRELHRFFKKTVCLVGSELKPLPVPSPRQSSEPCRRGRDGSNDRNCSVTKRIRVYHPQWLEFGRHHNMSAPPRSCVQAIRLFIPAINPDLPGA